MTSYLDKLCDDVLLQIVSKLGYYSLIRVSRSCKSLYRINNNEDLWKVLFGKCKDWTVFKDSYKENFRINYICSAFHGPFNNRHYPCKNMYDAYDITSNYCYGIPDEIVYFQNLNSLVYRFVDSKKYPIKISNKMGQLKKLISIKIKDSKLDEIPKEILQLTNLKFIILDQNNIQEISEEIEHLYNLECLILESNNIKQIPKEIGQLKKLELLNISKNKISIIPEEICMLGKLTHLNLSFNNIKKFPLGICKLKELTDLCISDNCLETVPNEIGELKKLKMVNLSNNKLSTLPESFVKLGGLKVLFLKNNNNDFVLPVIMKNMKCEIKGFTIKKKLKNQQYDSLFCL